MTITKSAAKGAAITTKMRTLGLLTLPGLALGTGVLWAADGFDGQLTIGQRFEYENDSGTTGVSDEGFSSKTNLGLNISTETRTQRLSFGLSGDLRAKLSGTSERSKDFALDNPTARLSYGIEARSTALNFEGSYRRNDINDASFLSDPLDPDSDIITGSGDRGRLALTTTLSFGQDAPLQTTLTHFYGETRYSDTVDPSLVNTETNNLGLDMSLQVNEQLSLSLSLDRNRQDAAGPGSSDRDSDRARIGATYDISPRTTVTAGLSYSEIETDDNAGNVTNRDGGGFDFGISHDVQNGQFTASFDESETVNGKRRQVSLGRSLDYARGTMSFTLGATKTDGLDVEPLLQAQATYELDELSGLNLSLSQASNVNDDNEESINTRLSIGYNRELSELSRISADFAQVDRNAQTGATGDQTSTRINLSHSYEFGQGLSLVSGYRYTKTDREGGTDTENSVLFLGLEKTFDF